MEFVMAFLLLLATGRKDGMQKGLGHGPNFDRIACNHGIHRDFDSVRESHLEFNFFKYISSLI